MERLQRLSSVGDEPMIKVQHAQESFEGLYVAWAREIHDAFDLARKRSDAISTYPVAEEIDFRNAQLAFLRLDDQPMGL